VPRALSLLARDPLLEGDYYPGDVLVSVLKVPAAYWSAHTQQLADIERVIRLVDDPDLKNDVESFRHRASR
jgi:contact-dependent growth inhibition (CDI) system CdiI-like immunity protein